MGNVHLVTGYAGEAHVAAEDMGSLFAAIVGEGQYVLNRGNMLSATVVSNNQIRIMDGDILMQGRHIRLNEGTYVDLTIENGAQGYMRNDLIVARYIKNEGTGVEDVNLVVVKGTAVASNPSDPAITTGNIVNEGASRNDMPLYRVQLDGINVQPLVCLFDTIGETLSGIIAHTSGTLDADRLPTVPVSKGGTGATTVAAARKNLGLGTTSGNLPILISQGGTGATDAATARSNLGITPANIGAAASSHNHSASDITSGTLGTDRLPTVPITKGGTGATNGATGLKNLLAAGNTVLSSYQYGTSLPAAGTKGRIFFKKV